MEDKTDIMTIRDELRKPFPAEAISQHPTKTFLSTIKAIYITERLNDVFGICGWTLEHNIVSDTAEYVAVCGRIVVGEPYHIATPYQYGGHGKTGKNTEPADGYKSAVTDCQSKCASYLEIGIDVFKGLTGKPKETKKTETTEEMKDFYPDYESRQEETTTKTDVIEKQVEAIKRILIAKGMTDELLQCETVTALAGLPEMIGKIEDLTKKEAGEVIRKLQDKKK